jgi:hypothetical protein
MISGIKLIPRAIEPVVHRRAVFLSFFQETDRPQGARYDRAWIAGRFASGWYEEADLLQGRRNDVSRVERIAMSIGASLVTVSGMFEPLRHGFGE